MRSIALCLLSFVNVLCTHHLSECSTLNAQTEVASNVQIVSRKVDHTLQGRESLIIGSVYDSLYKHYPGRFQVCTVNSEGDTVCDIVDNYNMDNVPQRGVFRISRPTDSYKIIVRIAAGNRILQSHPFELGTCEVVEFKFVFGGKPIH